MNQETTDVRKAEILAIQTLAQAVENLGRRFSSIDGKLDQVALDVAEMRGREYGRQIDAIRTSIAAIEQRIRDLEKKASEDAGRGATIEWIKDAFPWVAACGAGIAALFGWLRHTG